MTTTQARPVRTYDPPPHNGNGRATGTPGPKGWGGQNWLIWLCLRYRVVVACLGRRWGKTRACMMLILEKASRKTGDYRVGYGTPTARLARRRYDEFLGLFKRAGIRVRPNRQDLVLEVEGMERCTSITMFFWGLDEPDNVRGEGLDDLILDECKDILSRAYYSVLRPMLMDTGGSVLLMGTPSRIGKGAGWFWREYQAAKAGGKDRAWLTGPTHDNPTLKAADIQAAVEDVEREGKSVQEELFAQWLPSDGAVFENLPATFTVPWLTESHSAGTSLWTGEEPDRGVPALDPLHPGREPHHYCIGFDLALLRDYSVAAVFNRTTRDMAALMRMHRVPDDEQRRLVYDLHHRYNGATVLWDRTGFGVGFMGEMHRLFGKHGVPIVWSHAEKMADLRRARTLCQRAGTPEGWALIEAPWLYAEFEAYQLTTHNANEEQLATPKAGAPAGLHDDGVSACMLASRWLLGAQVPTVTTAKPRLFGVGWAAEQFERERLGLR